ncbi:aldo/keto reductase [Brachybacterium sp.]|uniref:aldo/keto reductase n=1 Tax=Brachybacterium sp. TaxID=1891286 RepID=UPI002ED4CA97
MQTRTLGQQGLTASAIGYGAMGTKMAYGPSDDTESIAAIRRAHDSGVTHFDTAELYGWGEGEKLLGAALRPIRNQVTIATKFGFTPSYGTDSRPEHIREVVEGSLRNLGVDHLDVLYQHIDDPAVPIEEVVGVMAEQVQAGTVSYLGLSNTSVANIRRAHAVHPISVLQTEYSLFAREAEEILPILEELGIGLVAYSPLARGFLTGAARPRTAYEADDARQLTPWWAPGNFEANQELVAELTALAESRDATISQLSLAWLLAQHEEIVPIPGSRSAARVDENIAAAALELSAADLDRIASIVPEGGIGGRLDF